MCLELSHAFQVETMDLRNVSVKYYELERFKVEAMSKCSAEHF
jgi:hypothetical protein